MVRERERGRTRGSVFVSHGDNVGVDVIRDRDDRVVIVAVVNLRKRMFVSMLRSWCICWSKYRLCST